MKAELNIYRRRDPRDLPTYTIPLAARLMRIRR
jgi:hypothetical protein